MKNLVFILVLYLFCAVSCKSQTTYSESVLREQSINIINKKKNQTLSKNPNSTLKIKDVLNELKVEPIQYGATPDSSEFESPHYVKYIVLEFNKPEEFRYKMDNKIKLYDIYLYLKNPIHDSKTFPLVRKTKGVWNKEVAEFFGNMEIKDIRIYDLEKQK